MWLSVIIQNSTRLQCSDEMPFSLEGIASSLCDKSGQYLMFIRVGHACSILAKEGHRLSKANNSESMGRQLCAPDSVV